MFIVKWWQPSRLPGLLESQQRVATAAEAVFLVSRLLKQRGVEDITINPAA